MHYLLMAWYLLGPIAVLIVAAVRAKRMRRSGPIVGYTMTGLSAALIATAIIFIYAQATGARWLWGQWGMAVYFSLGLLLLLKGLDGALKRGAKWLSTRSSDDPTQPARPWLRYTAAIGRVVLLFAIGLPYVMATIMTYRPKVLPVQTPNRPFEVVQFQADDGTDLVGWWIPATPQPAGDSLPVWGRRTILVCHGLAGNKSNHLELAEYALDYGYNLFIFDFRAHGESGGQLTTFGDRERLDVLAAVRWIQQNRADESRQLFGVGASMGAAALIAAAADPSPQGQAIDAVVVYGTYADLGDLASLVADNHFIRPLNWLVRYVAVPMAEVQTNRDLSAFAPAGLIATIWPRPVMIVHGLRDEIIPFTQGEALFNAAVPPRRSLWVERAGHNDVYRDRDVRNAVLNFFDLAKPVPVVQRDLQPTSAG